MKKIILIFLALTVLLPQPTPAKSSVKIIKWVEEPQFDLIDQMLFGLVFLLENSWVAGFPEHLETTILMVSECGMTREIEPLIGIIIAFHESWGLAMVRSEKTGDTGLMQIKPKYAYKPTNYENYKNAYSKAKKAGPKQKVKLLKKANLAKDLIYQDKYSITELQKPDTNVHVGCWSLAMWRDEWNGGSKKKGQNTYIAKYAGGSNPHARAWGFQKWVQHQVAKTKKRLGQKSTAQLLGQIAVLIYDNLTKRNSSAYLTHFKEKINYQKNSQSNFGKLLAKTLYLFLSYAKSNLENEFTIMKYEFVAFTLKLKAKPAQKVFVDNSDFIAKLNSYYK